MGETTVKRKGEIPSVIIELEITQGYDGFIGDGELAHWSQFAPIASNAIASAIRNQAQPNLSPVVNVLAIRRGVAKVFRIR